MRSRQRDSLIMRRLVGVPELPHIVVLSRIADAVDLESARLALSRQHATVSRPSIAGLVIVTDLVPWQPFYSTTPSDSEAVRNGADFATAMLLEQLELLRQELV